MEFMTVKEVSELFRVSEPTIYNWMGKESRPIPHHKKGNTIRFVKEDVVKWFKK